LPKQSRFCPECGQPVGEAETKVQELPPDETGPVPVEYTHAERRYYGVTPVAFAVGLAAVVVVAAVVLFATGHWPIGLILLGVGVLLLLCSVETGPFASRAGVAADSVATRGRATTRCSRSAASSENWPFCGDVCCSSSAMRCTVVTSKRPKPPVSASRAG
jgi:hypothetical protein